MIRQQEQSDPGSAMPGKTIEQVLAVHTSAWMATAGVTGTAISEHEGKPCILILISDDSDQIRKEIHAAVEGYPVVIQKTGQIRALDDL